MSPHGSSTHADKAVPGQSGFINLLKAGAAQLIILHHLAFYGPMADHVRPHARELIGWLDSHARIAVQVFLVIGGFLAAKSLLRAGPAAARPLWSTLWRRYIKLAPAFVVATLLAVGASAWARLWMTHDSISAPLELPQLAAHALFLHGILGYESISAGAWYVAIDFQLYATLALLAWLSQRLGGTQQPWLMPLLVVASVCASLLHFNRDAEWDLWAPYFFGSYGLGVLAWWASRTAARPLRFAFLLAAMLVPTLAALAIDFRSRIAVALVTACCLALMSRIRLSRLEDSVWINYLGQASYSIFLVHFPASLIVNAAFTRFAPAQPLWQASGMLIAWAASLAAGMAFHRWMELPIGRVLAAPRSASLVPGSSLEPK